MKPRILIAALAASLTPLLPSMLPQARAAVQPFRVVIDPGHGGADEGTVYDNGTIHLAEKDVTLSLAREAARQLRARGYEVILTRTRDRDVSLGARTALANRIGADVFLSIHMNSTATPMVTDAEGVETYILNNATDATSRRLAELENSVLSAEERTSPQEAEVSLILRDLRLDANLAESKKLACALQNNLTHTTLASSGVKGAHRHGPRRNRGVRQALFHVLLGADMPSVLVEAGFLTSPRDRALVLSPKGRKAVGRAIFRAVDRYRHEKLRGLSTCKVN